MHMVMPAYHAEALSFSLCNSQCSLKTSDTTRNNNIYNKTIQKYKHHAKFQILKQQVKAI